jgi:hypothetical protein
VEERVLLAKDLLVVMVQLILRILKEVQVAEAEQPVLVEMHQEMPMPVMGDLEKCLLLQEQLLLMLRVVVAVVETVVVVDQGLLELVVTEVLITKMDLLHLLIAEAEAVVLVVQLVADKVLQVGPVAQELLLFDTKLNNKRRKYDSRNESGTCVHERLVAGS